MKKIIVVSLSPAVDRNYTVKKLYPGKLHRCENPLTTPGGKGVNVARIISQLGAKAKLLGFFAGENGKFIINDMLGHEVDVETVMLEGETRNSINIIDSSTGEETEILEQGPFVPEEKIKLMEKRLEEFVSVEKGNCVAVFSGGVPTNVSEDIYERLTRVCKNYRVECFLDTSGKALENGIKAGPYFIKPNLREFSQIIGSKGVVEDISPENKTDKEKIYKIANKAKNTGVAIVAITMSEKGALLCTEDKCLYAHPLDINPVNSIGSGDAFTAGFAYSHAAGMSPVDCMRFAVSCAASNATCKTVGIIDPGKVYKYIDSVRIDEY